MTEWFLVQERYRNSFFPVYLVLEVMTKGIEQFSGKPLGKGVGVHEGSHVKWWLPTKDWNEVCTACLETAKKDPLIIKKVLKKFQKKSAPFLKFVKKTHSENLSRKTNAQLWKYYEKYCSEYRGISLYGEPMALFTKEQLSIYLEAYLKKLLAQKGLEKKSADFFSTLVSPTVPSFASREQLDLLKIVVQAKKNGFEATQKELKKHAKTFFWLPYDYEGEIWEKDYFEATVKELLQKPLNELEEQFQKQKNYLLALKKKQRWIEKQTGMDSFHKKLFGTMRDCSEAMDLKKEILTQSHWYKNSLMKEIAKRLGILFYHTYYLLREETKQGLLRGILDKKLLEERSRFCVQIIENGVACIETGEKAQEWRQLFEKFEQQSESKELQGQCACPGSAIGKARVLLNSNQIGEMQEGEILVAQATTPDFVPAMKKAKAIITNEGGITSHAAIVSRELGVPCIVGVGNATKQIKTGDLIDVHAASGIIKKIESAK